MLCVLENLQEKGTSASVYCLCFCVLTSLEKPPPYTSCYLGIERLQPYHLTEADVGMDGPDCGRTVDRLWTDCGLNSYFA
jgi:hypothetical protein